MRSFCFLRCPQGEARIVPSHRDKEIKKLSASVFAFQIGGCHHLLEKYMVWVVKLAKRWRKTYRKVKGAETLYIVEIFLN